MKKVIIMLCLFLLPFAFVYAQTEVDTIHAGVESDCKSNLENIFKVHDFMIKLDAVQSLYKELDIKDSIIRKKEGLLWGFKKYWDDYSMAIRGIPMVFENHSDSISDTKSKGCEIAEKFSEDQMNRFIKQIDCTPYKAFEEYMDYTRMIKLEKEKYLNCIDAELAKGDLSEYAKKKMVYTYIASTKPILGLPYSLTQLDFLKIFKEFVININNEVLPSAVTAYVYLNCNCHIPFSVYKHEMIFED